MGLRIAHREEESNGMTYIVTVTARHLSRWPRSEQRLVLDVETRQHYRVVTVFSPWRHAPFSRVYATDPLGTLGSIEGIRSGFPRMVAGGDDMTTDEAVADLTQRLSTGTLLSVEESLALDQQFIESDADLFKRYIQPTVTTQDPTTQRDGDGPVPEAPPAP